MAEQDLITPEYARQNKRLHESCRAYGIIGFRWVKKAEEICSRNGYTTVLDYGCGKGTFKAAAPEWMTVHEYDPAIPEKRKPVPAELVVCTDVLEHVEPRYLNNVIAHIREMGQHALIVVSTTASDKSLPDGRNAHLILADDGWWYYKLSQSFDHIEVLPKRKKDEPAFEAW